jgi:crossover junction endodeoxyribonuclease RuvC
MMRFKTSTPMQNKSLGESDERVLAIDPGFDRVGAAILHKENFKEKLLFSECVVTNKKDPHATRLLSIGNEIARLIKEWGPEALAIEKLFFNQSTTSALGVAEARGVIIYEAARAGISIYEYSPQEIKIATTGYGKATKVQVEEMSLRLLGISKKPHFDDEADAIALGITHLASYKHKERLSPQSRK